MLVPAFLLCHFKTLHIRHCFFTCIPNESKPFPIKRRHPQFIQGEVVEICDSLEAGSFSEASLAALQQLFTKCLEVSPMSTPDLVLSSEEVPWSQCHL